MGRDFCGFLYTAAAAVPLHCLSCPALTQMDVSQNNTDGLYWAGQRRAAAAVCFIIGLPRISRVKQKVDPLKVHNWIREEEDGQSGF